MQKEKPGYSIKHVFHPERDGDYKHFENAAAHPFQNDSTGFPRVNAWWLAESALLAYWDEAGATPIFRDAGLESKFVRVAKTDCYVAWRDGVVIVAFRGTEPDEWGDILTDAKMKLVPWTTGNVHRGFAEAIEKIWPTLRQVPALAGEPPVWFCGHSLGAALAVLAADRYAKTRGVCTFGCPRVGDDTFAASFNAKLGPNSLRYVNDHDIVTHVPPEKLRYKHVERGRFIGPDGVVTGNPPKPEHFFTEVFGAPVVLLEQVNGLMSGVLMSPHNALLDHMPKAYAIWTWNDYDTNG